MTPQTLRKERRRKFDAVMREYYGDKWDAQTSGFREGLLSALADAAESRTERKTDEAKGDYITQADRKVDVIILQARQARQAEESGQAYRGREFLVGSEYLTYGDWWHKKTGLHMYGAKAKAKVSPDWLKAFREWADNELTIKSLDAAFDANKWRGVISTPVVLTKDAIAIQAVPVVETTQAKVYRAEDEPQKEYVPAPARKR